MSLKNLLKKASFMAMLGGSAIGIGGHQEKQSQTHYDVCEYARMEQSTQEFNNAQNSYEYALAQSYLSRGKSGVSGEYHFDPQNKIGTIVFGKNDYQRIIEENKQGHPILMTEKFPNGEKNIFWRDDGTIKLKTESTHSEILDSDLREEYDTQGRLAHLIISKRFPQMGRKVFSEKNFKNGFLVDLKEIIEMKNGPKRTHKLSIFQENEQTLVSEEFNGDIRQTLYEKESKIKETFFPKGDESLKIETHFDENGQVHRVPMTPEQRQARLAKYRSEKSQ